MAPVVVCAACVKNAGRSQMTRAWIDELVEPESAVAISAGSAPGPEVHPEVVEAMREVGVDLAGIQPIKLTSDLVTSEGVNMIITMGCGEACPYVAGVEIINWDTPDPHGQSVQAVREIRDFLKGKVLALAAERGWKLKGPAS